jgi:hypothetical protein
VSSVWKWDSFPTVRCLTHCRQMTWASNRYRHHPLQTPDYTKWQTSWILMALKYFITYPGRSVDDRVWTPGVSQPCTPWVRENACGKLLRQTSICRLLLDAMWIFLWISIWDNLSAYIHILGSTHISIYVYINPKFPKQRTSTNLVLLVDHMHWCQGFRATETGNPAPITAVIICTLW